MVGDLGVDWGQAQDALRAEVSRVTTLLRSARDPTARAVGEWNLAEVAMHLSQAWVTVPALARGDLSRIYEVLPNGAGPAGGLPLPDLWDLGGMTIEAVRADPERDLGVLADRIEARALAFFDECTGREGEEVRPWLVQGTSVPLSTLTCHLLNETVMHGADIARAERRPWRIDPAHARLVLLGFLAPVLGVLDPRTMLDPAKAAGLRATYHVRLRGGGGFHLVFDGGGVRVETPSSRPVDCHVLADPVALLQVMWGRQSQWAAIATGKLLAWGRRPWLGPKLRTVMRNP